MKNQKKLALTALALALILLCVIIGLFLAKKKHNSESSDSTKIENNTTDTPNESDNDATEESNEDQWKVAYIDYINNHLSKDPYEGYTLIHIDDNAIPELVAFGSSEAQGNIILSYDNDSVIATQLSRLGFYYIEKENLLNNADGHMDFYYDYIYSFVDGQLTKIATGIYGALDSSNEVEVDEEGNVNYQYAWEGHPVTKEEYEESLKAIFDKDKAISGFDIERKSADEITKMIEEY